MDPYKILNFNYNGIFFLVFAGVIVYAKGNKGKYLMICLALISFLMTDSKLLSLNYNLYSINDYFSYYDSSRVLMYRENGELVRQTLDMDKLRDALFSCVIDVGTSSYWSEISAVNTLDMLLKSGHISFVQYLERLPDGIIPKKKELIEETKEILAAKQSERTIDEQQYRT